MRDVEVTGEIITLQQLLQLAGAVDTGGEAKNLIGTLAVSVNGEPEGRRGRKLRAGDVVEVAEGETCESSRPERLRVVYDALDPAIGQEPDDRDGDDAGEREPGLHERQGEGDDVEQQRDLALAVAADGLRELGAGFMQGEQRDREQRERDRAAEQDERVGGDRARLARRPRPARRC